MDKLVGVLGLFVMLGIAFLFCKPEHRKHINLRVVIGGTLLQLAFAILILKTPVKILFTYANDAVTSYTFNNFIFVNIRLFLKNILQ